MKILGCHHGVFCIKVTCVLYFYCNELSTCGQSASKLYILLEQKNNWSLCTYSNITEIILLFILKALGSIIHLRSFVLSLMSLLWYSFGGFLRGYAFYCTLGGNISFSSQSNGCWFAEHFSCMLKNENWTVLLTINWVGGGGWHCLRFTCNVESCFAGYRQ